MGNRVIGLYEINVPTAASIVQANNLYVYCGNNPHIYIDSTGQAWYHWVIGAAVVAVAAVAVVATAGGAAAAVTAVTLVANGTAAATTASTVAAGAFMLYRQHLNLLRLKNLLNTEIGEL